MRFDTKLAFFFKNFYKYGKRKFISFQTYFTNSVFFLLFGFLAGNLFGSLLTIFKESIMWHGFITILIVFLVEMTNYLIYNWSFSIQEKNKAAEYNLKNIFSYQNTYFQFPFKLKKKNKSYQVQMVKINIKAQSPLLCLKKLRFFLAKGKNLKLFSTYFVTKKLGFSFKKTPFSFCRKTKFFKAKQGTRKKKQTTMRAVIKSLNLFKIGVLLGFFIDAFKVGS